MPNASRTGRNVWQLFVPLTPRLWLAERASGIGDWFAEWIAPELKTAEPIEHVGEDAR